MMNYINHPRILGLGEVMDYQSVISGDRAMFDKLNLFQSKIIDGHAPYLVEKELNTYALSGIKTDHECCDFEYARNEIRNGMYVLIREGSAAKNLEAIVKGIVTTGMDTSRFCFCTDDKHIESIKQEGHISYNVKKAIEFGIPPIKAIKMATINPAICYGLKRLGAIAPGYQADFIILDDLERINVNQVYHKGKRAVTDEAVNKVECPNNLKNTIHLDGFNQEDLVLRLDENPFPVIHMLDEQIVTKCKYENLSGGQFFLPYDQYKKIAVIERHKGTKKTGVGVVTGFDISHGAIASSVSHDSHNIIVIGDNDEDMTIAVNELIRTQGGYTLVEQGNIVGTLPLPIMGLMSDIGFDTVNQILHTIISKAHEMGISKNMDPFITLSFMALPVIPEIRITTRGVYHVSEGKFLR
jgi:adenine deaminase